MVLLYTCKGQLLVFDSHPSSGNVYSKDKPVVLFGTDLLEINFDAVFQKTADNFHFL